MYDEHYKDMPVEPIELMRTVLTKEEFLGFLKGNCIKYAMRAGYKGQMESDIDKWEQYRAKLAAER